MGAEKLIGFLTQHASGETTRKTEKNQCELILSRSFAINY